MQVLKIIPSSTSDKKSNEMMLFLFCDSINPNKHIGL